MLHLTREEAYSLASQDLDYLLKVASSIRDANKGRIISYSRKVFIPLTYLCRDFCSYCTYKKEDVSIMEEEEALAIAEEGKRYGCTEALLVTGERPEQKYGEIKDWLNSRGFRSTPEYISYISKLILDKTGLLPHTNAGILNAREMSILRETNPSLGSMLENVSNRLLEHNMPHEHAPSKNPRARIKMLEDAGRLKIPFTTGILLGIGETIYEAIDSLLVIKDIHERYKHIQEVIIQNFIPKPNTPMANADTPSMEYILRITAIARILMPDMNIQVPPNLTPNRYARYIDAGINDWGGISPVTIDHVNPEMPWPKIIELDNVTSSKGYTLKARLPVYPEFINKDMLDENLFAYISKSIIDDDGYVRSGMT
ncbi:MAG: 7,8-didemethyl-8-hydroxy-5-deazariboflavin synthase subunit CofG [Candidatus Nitrosocaldaceae archaeon]|nr:MAG: 7,8-didemethyl-8-hydroxy-5-deazariboflavin synthase subunit CofG [Candidatus Nitrosocaldaceae archaeon]